MVLNGWNDDPFDLDRPDDLMDRPDDLIDRIEAEDAERRRYRGTWLRRREFRDQLRTRLKAHGAELVTAELGRKLWIVTLNIYPGGVQVYSVKFEGRKGFTEMYSEGTLDELVERLVRAFSGS